LLAGVVAAGCAMPPYVKTAYYGDLVSLKREIQSAAAKGKLDRAAVVDLASAVARREVRSAQGDEAVQRIRASGSCARVVEPELRARVDTGDDVGAEAMLVLIDAGRVGKGSLVDKYAASPDGAWRAVAARASVRHDDGPRRRAFFVDADERVRRGALHAAFEAADPADLEPLLETARLDPDDADRALAVRAAATIGGERVSAAFVDLWPSQESEGRLALVEGWAMPRVYDQGGAVELVKLAESGDAIASVAAAGALARIGKADANVGRAALVRAIDNGTTDERILAVEECPLTDPDAVAALARAAHSDDPVVRVVALARQLELPAERRTAQTALEQIAKSDDAAARQARLALSVAGDSSAIPLLEQDLAAAGPDGRARAALGLFRLGRPAFTAFSLADGDPSVRMSVACAVVAADASG
jgi:hypothetical protein